jgi:hypothetical protein
MDTNPYSPPATIDDGPVEQSTIQYRVFRGKPASFRLTASTYHEEVRREAQRAIETEIGGDNVVSIAEHAGSFGAFTVVVWYRVHSNEA